MSIELDGFDILKPESYARMLKYDVIVNCVGFTKGHMLKDENINLNYRAVIGLVAWCNKHKKKYVHISTDIVYAGTQCNALETDVPVHAANWYAYSKLLADGYVQAVCNDYLLIRTAFKPRPFPYKKVFLKFGNFDYVDVIAELIIDLMGKNACGVYNVGTKTKSMWEHARETVPDIETADSIPVDVTMNLEKMKGLLCAKE